MAAALVRTSRLLLAMALACVGLAASCGASAPPIERERPPRFAAPAVQ